MKSTEQHTSPSQYYPEEVWLPCSETLLDWDEGFHKLLLGDRPRMYAYENAIKSAVKPGMTVLDLGTGTGILAYWALQAGAAKVYAIDLDRNTLDVAIKRMGDAGFSDRFLTYNEISYNVVLPERVDVILSEIIGNLADNEDFGPILKDAIHRFAKESTLCIPKTVTSFLVPVCAKSAHRQVQHRNCRVLNENYSLIRLLQQRCIASSFDLYYDAIIPRNTYLSEPRKIRVYEGAWVQEPSYNVEQRFAINKEGLCTGFKGYFIANLTADWVLDISNDDISQQLTSDSWKHAYLPIEEPIKVRNGDSLVLSFSRGYPAQDNSTFKQWYRWQGEVVRRNEVIGRFSQSSEPKV